MNSSTVVAGTLGCTTSTLATSAMSTIGARSVSGL